MTRQGARPLTGALLWKTPVGEHNGHDNDSLLMLEHQNTVKPPYVIAPGSYGGILANMALAARAAPRLEPLPPDSRTAPQGRP